MVPASARALGQEAGVLPPAPQARAPKQGEGSWILVGAHRPVCGCLASLWPWVTVLAFWVMSPLAKAWSSLRILGPSVGDREPSASERGV